MTFVVRRNWIGEKRDSEVVGEEGELVGAVGVEEQALARGSGRLANERRWQHPHRDVVCLQPMVFCTKVGHHPRIPPDDLLQSWVLFEGTLG